jgi:YkoY family integral membrane protein
MEFLPSLVDLQAAVPVIISLIIIEGLLSVDNALAIAAMASHLPGEQKQLALKLGIIGAYVFRGIALFCAGAIIANPWLKIAGAAYLIYLMSQHFAEKAAEEEVAEEEGGESAVHTAGRGLVATIVAIEIMDLSLSVDNVVAAVALSDKLWVVCTGVFIGILALRFVAGLCIKLIERFPILESTSFVLIGYVGGLLLAELITHVHIGPLGKFIGIVIILALALLYAEIAGFQKVARPVLKFFVPIMKLVDFIVGGFFQLIFWPFKKAWSLVRR